MHAADDKFNNLRYSRLHNYACYTCYTPLAANSQRTSGGPLSDTEIRQWESQTRQHAVDAVDALEKNDLIVANASV